MTENSDINFLTSQSQIEDRKRKRMYRILIKLEPLIEEIELTAQTKEELFDEVKTGNFTFYLPERMERF